VRELLLLLVHFRRVVMLAVRVGRLLPVGIIASFLLETTLLFLRLVLAVEKFRVNFRLADTMTHGTAVASRYRNALLVRLNDLLFAKATLNTAGLTMLFLTNR
jgi:hypothetical protein